MSRREFARLSDEVGDGLLRLVGDGVVLDVEGLAVGEVLPPIEVVQILEPQRRRPTGVLPRLHPTGWHRERRGARVPQLRELDCRLELDRETSPFFLELVRHVSPGRDDSQAGEDLANAKIHRDDELQPLLVVV